MKRKSELRRITEASIYIALGACVYELSVQGPAHFRFSRVLIIAVAAFALIWVIVKVKNRLRK